MQAPRNDGDDADAIEGHEGTGHSKESVRRMGELMAAAEPQLSNPAGQERVFEGAAEAWSESDEEEPDISAAVYTSSCKESKQIMCRRWLRACEERLAVCELHHYGVGPRGAIPFAASLQVNSHVEVLNLSDNGLGPIGVSAMLRALNNGGASALTELDLSQNQAGQEGAEALAALLLDASGRSDITGLATLDFGNNGIGDQGAKAIAAALAQPGGRTDDLKAFSLARNEITAEGANALAACLATNSSLESLSLQWNSIAEGETLARALGEQRTLTTLDLAWNGLGDAGAAALAAAVGAIPHGEGVRHLDIAHNRMSSHSTSSLCELVSRLDALSVSGNPLGGDSVGALLIAHRDAGGQCELQAEQVAVRPDTAVAHLIALVAAGQDVDIDAHMPPDLVRRAEAARAASQQQHTAKEANAKAAGKPKRTNGASKTQKAQGKTAAPTKAKKAPGTAAPAPAASWNRDVQVEPMS